MCYFPLSEGTQCVERTKLKSILEEANFSDWLDKGYQIPAFEENRQNQ